METTPLHMRYMYHRNHVQPKLPAFYHWVNLKNVATTCVYFRSYVITLQREKERAQTFFPSSRFSRISVSGFTYCARLVMLFVSNEWIPEPVKSTASTLNPLSSRSVIVLYQHQAPKPPPWTRMKWFVSRPSIFTSYKENWINELKIVKSTNHPYHHSLVYQFH